MKYIPYKPIRKTLLLLALIALAGCGGGGSGDESVYGGKWAGPTSHGGTVSFTVENGWVTSFRVTDAGASIWIEQPTDVVGDTFEAHNSENGSAAGAPGATVTGLFDSAAHGTGNYTLTQSSHQWMGTYTATKQ
jgi:hypothetical protein